MLLLISSEDAASSSGVASQTYVHIQKHGWTKPLLLSCSIEKDPEAK